ncbi:hypothetical protein PGT21_006073 [Puccinia graminis f. sp. tritici]|uniref:Uncharacterized protein n=2 Tax=Puccinia graminis f. sp. tritici TaxID=56615 RepID=A0A5B0PTF2_PUCGR|nr:hypothetical protein PGT21_006073 [Puccinia graminis f. sp. tritici]
MAENIPDWTIRPTQWAVLRDQIAATSKPSLSQSIRLSSFILIALCSLSIFVHLSSLWLRLSKRSSSSSRLFSSTSSGYHQPDLTLILPLIFLINAILNLASLSSLLSDANRLKFKAYTMAIQQFNFSLLLSAGILITWALVCGLPPLRIGMCGSPRSRWGQPRMASIDSRKPIKPSRLHSIVYASLALVFVVPLPCIILSSKAIEDINILDRQLLLTVNHVLETVEQPPARDVISNALQTISKLDQVSTFLFLHIRMLSSLHLFLTFAILSSCLWLSLHIIRKIHTHDKQPSSSPPSTADHHPAEPLTVHDESYKIHQLTRLAEPKPALIVHPHGNIPPGHPSIEVTHHDNNNPVDLAHFGPTSTTHNASKHASSYSNRIDSFASETYLVPSLETDPHHQQDPHLEDLRGSSHVDNYIKKLKSILILLGTCGAGFMVLNFCIMTNSIRYPDEMSIGDLLILKLEWSTWLWNGSISPLLGLTNCYILSRNARPSKKIAVW